MSISGIDETTPLDTAFVGDGAGQIRDLKAAIKAVFPGVGGAITKPAGYNSTGSTTPTEADFSQLFTDMDALFGASNSSVIPIGTISAWFGNPTDTTALNAQGWYLCDGGSYNGFATPNLQNRFIKGWDGTDNRGASGGASIGTLRTSEPFLVGTGTPKTVSRSSTYTLTEANIPEHSHKLFAPEQSSNYHGGTGGYSGSIAASSTINGTDGAAVDAGPHGEKDYVVAQSGSLTPTVGDTSRYGNSSTSPISIDTGLTESEFLHDHTVEVSGDLEPSHFVLAWICYCGVV